MTSTVEIFVVMWEDLVHFFTLPLLYFLNIFLSAVSSSLPAVISMQMSSFLHYPDYDWARFVSGSAFQDHLVILKVTFHFSAALMLAGVTLQVINLQHYCLFDFGMELALCWIYGRQEECQVTWVVLENSSFITEGESGFNMDPAFSYFLNCQASQILGKSG